MIEKIRVLVVERSPEIRKVLTQYLSSDPKIHVVGVAANHSSAIKQIKRLHPDIITLDEELSGSDGTSVLLDLHKRFKTLPVLVLSPIDQSTVEALQARPPSKHQTKLPRRRAIVCRSQEDQRFTELCKRIHELVDKPLSSPPVIKKSPPHVKTERVSAIGIAVSTGGPSALAKIVQSLSPEIDVPILVTQHMPAHFTPLLAERLDTKTPLRVREARDGDLVLPGTIYVTPGGFHLGLRVEDEQVLIELLDTPVPNGCRPSADIMFSAMADVFGGRTLGIVLTGMGVDGQQGCKKLKEQGAFIIAQDESTCTVWGMPKAIINAGIADSVLTLDEIASTINDRCTSKRGAS